jgi:hypothetical protein
MKEYMNGSGASDSVETLYESALQINGFLKVVQFFGKGAEALDVHTSSSSSTIFI